MIKRLSACLALLLLSWSQAGAEEQSEFTIKYFETTRGRLAFTYIKGEQRRIYVLDFATLTVDPLTKAGGKDDSPAWSPDGQKLAFVSDVSGDEEIFVINADGTGLTRLTKSPGPDNDPAWSPDGKKIVFSSARNGEGRKLYIMEPDGTKPEALPITKRKLSAINSQPRWSPRGNELLYTTNEDWPGWDVAVFNFQEGKPKILTTGFEPFQRPSWHPSGGSFIFSYGSGQETGIWECTKGAKELTPLISRPGKNFDATWTHDANKIFFAGEKAPGQGDFQVFVWDKGSRQIQEVLEASGSVRYLAWTPLPSLNQLEKEIERRLEKPQP